MFCGKCGCKLPEGSNICEKCETVLDVLKLSNMQKKVKETEKQKGTINSFFIEPDEKQIAELGNGFLVNLLFHRPRKCSGILTDKRVYLKGIFYSESDKGILKTVKEAVIDVEDITGTGFIYQRISRITLFWSFLSAVLSILLILWANRGWERDGIMFAGIGVLILAIILLIKALMSKKEFFYIQYAGGDIKFDASLIGLGDVRDFQKQVRRVKDYRRGHARTEPTSVSLD